jgi:hypothetical protein
MDIENKNHKTTKTEKKIGQLENVHHVKRKEYQNVE